MWRDIGDRSGCYSGSAGAATGSSGAVVAGVGVDLEVADEGVVDEHVRSLVVEDDVGGLALPFDAEVDGKAAVDGDDAVGADGGVDSA